MQIEGQEGQCQGYANTRQTRHRVEGDGCNGRVPEFEDPLRNRHLATLPLDPQTLVALKVQVLPRRVEQGDRLQDTALDLLEHRSAHPVGAFKGDGTLKRGGEGQSKD